jgi:hypothetical protein
MTVRRVQKEALIAATITFDQTGSENERIDPSSPNNFIDVISLTALGGNPVTPGAGTYEIHVKTDVDGGFKAIADNGSLAGSKTGGSASADGVVEGASFTGLPIAVKIVPTGITVAVAYRVLIKQTSAQ